MAETRKHRVEVRDELDKAIQAALGAPVRPQEPGARAEPEASGAAEPTASDTVKPHTTPFITPGSTMGGFTFATPTPTKKN